MGSSRFDLFLLSGANTPGTAVESLDPYWLGFVWIEVYLFQFIGANALDFLERINGPLGKWTKSCAPSLHCFLLLPLLLPVRRISSSAEIFLSTIRLRATPYAGLAVTSRLRSSTGGLVSYFRRSSTAILSTRAMASSTLSDGLRRLSSISDKNAADKPPNFFANSRSDKSRSSRSSRIRSPNVFIDVNRVSLQVRFKNVNDCSEEA